MNKEKTYRVIFRKNKGHGKRIRVLLIATSLTELSITIAQKAKEERYRPMRIQEMNGAKITNKYKIKFVDGEYDIIKAKERPIIDIPENENTPQTPSTNNSKQSNNGLEFDID
jgi:hypothetical protein